MAQRRHNFISGAAVLAFAVAVTKVLGALYKIPLGNLLDNALEAAAQAAEPAVEVDIREKAGSILIYVRNTFSPDLSPDLRRTTKTDKTRHGIGHEIVENLCRKYSGSFSYSINGTTFEATAMVLDLPLKETMLV